MLKLLNFSCSRCSFPSDHSDHFLVNINKREVARLEAQVAYLKKSIALKAEKRFRAARGPRP